jgi:hypothetical protein
MTLPLRGYATRPICLFVRADLFSDCLQAADSLADYLFLALTLWLSFFLCGTGGRLVSREPFANRLI